MRAAFYDRPVLEVARDLVGCVVMHGGCAGVIVETEAYHDSEPACHAFVGLTPRTQTLFGPPGRAYVYRSYGIHALLNAVSEPAGIGAAVLIRALEPLEGIDEMRARRGLERLESLCSGPGKLTQALGIELAHNGCDLAVGPVVISGRPRAWRGVEIAADTRIGITRATELPWRFSASNSRFVSRRVRRPSDGVSALVPAAAAPEAGSTGSAGCGAAAAGRGAAGRGAAGRGAAAAGRRAPASGGGPAAGARAGRGRRG